MKGLAAVLVVLLIWACGLLAFAERVQALAPAPDPPAADAIVVLTGASDLRLEAATKLLEDGKGRRLLVSGVNRKTTRRDILGVTGAGKRLFDCCVDLGFTASDTIGNARESAEWARAMGFKRLILVTSDFHMPRALLELRGAMPEAEITPYAVATPSLDVRRWASSGEAVRRLAVEYSKYLAILAREAVLSAGPKDAPQDVPRDARPAARPAS